MLRHFKSLLVLVLVMAVVRQGSAFTLWTSPMQTWQTAALCYGVRYWYNYSNGSITNNQPPRLPGNAGYTELGGPAPTLLLGSRLNVGVTTYAYDPTFLEYYGAAGVKAVDAAFAIMNSLPTASSADLSKFITQGNQQVNYTARALCMLDLKSTVLQLLVEHMGLLGETHVFDMYAQIPITGGAACDSAYIVVNDNYDPGTLNPSTYVNGTRYDYQIWDGCAAGLAYTDAMEEVYDEPGGVSLSSSAVATQEALQIGGFYLGLTRDDVGGLKFLYSKNNPREEAMFTDVYVGATDVLSTGFNSVITNAVTNATLPGMVGGVEKVTFMKVPYNPLSPSTNVLSYTITGYTNGAKKSYVLWRTNTTPDIIISAANLLTTGGTTLLDTPFTRTYAFIASPETAYYPSTMSPTMTLVINDAGPLYINESPNFMQGSALFLSPYFQFGSFDGSTNPPVAFPNGSSTAALAAVMTTSGTGLSIVTSPFNSIVGTNTITTGGTTAGTVPVQPLKARPVGGNSQ